MTDFIQTSSLANVSEQEWDALLPDDHLFVRYQFLKTLEDAGVVGRQSGWQPSHLLVKGAKGKLVAALPAYIKDHSYGEYVFDWSWADAYARYGMDYYPKLQLAVPFTPVTGPRVLGKLEQLPEKLNQFCEQNQLTGWHMTFPDDASFDQVVSATDSPELSDEAQSLPHERIACQFHWFNQGYLSFDHYLESFVSRKRKMVKKERKLIAAEGITLSRLTGKEISEDMMDFFYQCYLDTYAKRLSTPYLNRTFFQLLRERMADNLLLVVAEKDQQPCASALYFYDSHTLYGRYWGCLQDHNSLHFEACYYQGIEFCIEQGIQTFNPGTQGEHKISRGFEPVQTQSLHWLSHPEFHRAVGDFVSQEATQIKAYQKQAASLLPFRLEQA